MEQKAFEIYQLQNLTLRIGGMAKDLEMIEKKIIQSSLSKEEKKDLKQARELVKVLKSIYKWDK